jgi:hypothetical protein
MLLVVPDIPATVLSEADIPALIHVMLDIMEKWMAIAVENVRELRAENAEQFISAGQLGVKEMRAV